MKKMRQLYLGTTGDIKTLEHHFGLMAAQGWMIDKINQFTHRYRAAAPCEKRFFVDLLPQVTAFDYPENEDVQDYRRICEESGWHFVTANKQLHVFCAGADAPDPVPIHTDNRIQAQIYLNMYRKYEMPQYVLTLLMLCISLFTQFSTNGMEIFLSDLLVFFMLGFAFFLAGYAWPLGFTAAWYRRTKKNAKLDLPMPPVNYRLSRARNRTFAACAAICVACFVTGILLEISGGLPFWFLLFLVMPLSAVCAGLWIRRQIDTRRRSRKANIWLFVAALVVMELVFLGATGAATMRMMKDIRVSPYGTPDSLGGYPALTLSSLGIETPPDSVNARVKGSVAVPVHYSYWEMNRQGNVHTEVYRPVVQALARGLYRRYVKDLEKGYSDGRGYDGEVTWLHSSEAAFWGAGEGVAAFDPVGGTAELILLRGKTLLRLSFYGEDIDLDAAARAVQELWQKEWPKCTEFVS